MYAIVRIAGLQYKVLPDKLLYVRYLGGSYKEGEEIIFHSMVTNNIQVKIKILAHIKDDKVNVFKKKRRKGYQLNRGYRQKISLIKIISIN